MRGLSRWERSWVACAAILFPACSSAVVPAGGPVHPGAYDVSPTVHDARFDTVRAYIQRLVNEEGVPSIAVAVAKDGEVLWEEGFGWADRERRVRATPHTPYSLASITKPITSTGIMVLSERGAIDLDAPLENYLRGIRFSGIAGDTREVTPRRAMAHSAGLPTHFRAYFAGDELPSAKEMLGRYGIVVFPPGKRFQYSNVGYRSLDVAIANASGQSYGEFLRREVFMPLGMTRSAVDLDPQWASEAATRYDEPNKPIPPYVTDHPGSGDVWASAHDMLRFAAFHLGTPFPGQQPILRPQSIAAMQGLAGAPNSRYGLGWGLRQDRGYRIVQHDGGQPGVATQMTLYPDQGLAIIVLSNWDEAPTWEIARRIAAAVLPDSADPGKAASTEPPPSRLPELSGRWVGTVTTYQGTMPIGLAFQSEGDIHATFATTEYTSLVRNVGRSEDALTGVFYGRMTTSDVLPHPHDLSFALRVEDDELIGQLTALGTDAVFALSSFVRLKRVDQELLEEYVGVYHHGENDLRVVTREGDRLYSRRDTGRQLELNAVGEDLFLMAGTGGRTLRFERENGRVVAVEWSGGGGLARRVN